MSLRVAALITEHNQYNPLITQSQCSCLSHSGFVEKNNDSLNRNLKEVSLKKSLITTCINPCVSGRADMWLCGLVSFQVMCQSDNHILSHCFRREEVMDQKRPEMVRIILSLSVSLPLPLSSLLSPFSFLLFPFSLSLSLSLSLHTHNYRKVSLFFCFCIYSLGCHTV